jgi:hypothetical protein
MDTAILRTALLTAIGYAMVASPAAARAEGGALHSARQTLQHYDTDLSESATLSMLRELYAFAQSGAAVGRDQVEARFLRAAAATDLFVLARVRADNRLQQAVEAALGTQDGSSFKHLDSELEACSGERAYAVPAAQMRAALALAREPRPADHLASYRGVTGSQRDLLFLHAMTQLAISEGNPLAALAAYGDAPTPGSPVALAFNTQGARTVATLLEAGAALKRLDKAAQDGDPLAATASIERAIFAITIPEIVVPAAPNLGQEVQYLGSSKAPDVVLWIGERGMRYGFSPNARLATSGEIKLEARGEPRLPDSAELKFPGKSLPFIHPIAELTIWLRELMAAQPDCNIAIAVEPNATTAMALANALASFKRAGGSELVVIGPNARGQMSAQTVGVIFKMAGDADAAPPAEVSVRVRLGGYSVKTPYGVDQDIPRIHDENGWRFDTDGLEAKLSKRRFGASQISFMPDVALDQVTAALFQVGANVRTVSLLLQ